MTINIVSATINSITPDNGVSGDFDTNTSSITINYTVVATGSSGSTPVYLLITDGAAGSNGGSIYSDPTLLTSQAITSAGTYHLSFVVSGLTQQNDYILYLSDVSTVTATPYDSQSLVIDLTAPAAPALVLATDSGSSGSDHITNSGLVNVTGLEAGATWQYSLNGGSSWTTGTGTSFNVTGDGAKSALVRQSDVAGNQSANSAALAFTLDTTAPTSTSFTLTEVSPTNAGVIHYTITFSEAVTGVNAAQFNLVAAGVTGANISSVTSVPGSGGTQYTIAVDTGSGDGSIGLNFVGGNVHDIAGNSVGSGSANIGSFQPQTSYAAENAPAMAVIGDVNGDGKLDLAVSNIGSASVSVLLGNGDGTFQSQASYSVDALPYSVVIGDLNGDNRPELIVGNTGSHTISVLVNNGNGTYQDETTINVADVPELITVKDINGDGKLDLLIPYLNLDAISVRLGNGNGTFQGETLYATEDGPTSVSVADVNGDSKLDLVAANWYSNTLSVLLGNGNGTFQPQTSYAVLDKPITIGIGDFNGDSRPDLVVADSNSNAVSVLLGNGDGTFQTQTAYSLPGTPYAVAIADLNGDGRLDIVAPNAGSNSVSILFGNGDGTFQSPVNYGTQSFPHSISIADLNGDGSPDLVTANLNSGSVSILLNGSSILSGPTEVIDKTAPAAPVITTTVPLITNAVFIDLVGTAEANSTVTVLNGAAQVGTAVADATGNWHINNFALTSGVDYNLTAKAADTAGNVSAASDVLSFHDDQSALSSPVITTTVPSEYNAALIDITGTAGPNTTIKLYDFGALVATTTTDGAGHWHVNGIALSNGADYSFTATATNAANHTSDPSNALAFHDDQVAPDAPAIASIVENNNGGINGAEAANGTPVSVSLAGTGAVEGDTLSIDWGGQTIAYTLLTSDILAGSATVTISAGAIAAQGNGTFDVTAHLTDAANNISADSSPMTVTVDTAAPIVGAPSTQTDLWTANNPAGAGNVIFGSSHANAITVTDNGSADLTVSLSVGAGNTFTLGSTSGVSVVSGANGSSSLTISGSAAQINAALENSTFHTDSTNAAVGNVDATVNITATDTTGNSTASAINIDAVSSQITFNWATGDTSFFGTTLGVTLTPSGPIAQNDLLIAFVTAQSGFADPGAVVAPAGWTELDNTHLDLDGTFSDQFAVFYRIAGAGESGGYSFTWSTVSSYSWALVDIGGVDPTHPIDVSGGQSQEAGFGTQTIAPSLNVSGSYDALLSLWMTKGGIDPYAADPTTTVLVDINSTASDRPELMIGGELLTSSGPTQTNVMTSGLGTVDQRGFSIALNPVCFMPGTLIRTPLHDVAVETLEPGDLVVTGDGRTVQVRWLGRQTVSKLFGDPLRVLPIRIRAGALDDNVPTRDLLVSPDHALLVGGVLVHAGALVNGDTITREADVPETFTYFHVEVDDHSLIFANDTPAETFIDNVDRLAFDNWDEHQSLYPDGKMIEEMPYPRAKSHRQVPGALRRQLAQRCAAVGTKGVSAAA